MRLFVTLIATLILTATSPAFGQEQIGFKFKKGSRRLEMPFERYNNLVVIPVTIKGQVTLNFVLDTGVQNTILTDRLYADLLGLDFDREVVIRGPGENDSIQVYVIDNIDMNIGKIIGKNTPMIVLEEDFLKLSNNLGADVHGIIGYEIFRQFVVEVDFDAKKIVFHDPTKFKKRSYYKQRYFKRVPISIERRKPYVTAKIEQRNGVKANTKLMVDTGASHAVLLNPATNNKISVPEENIESLLGRGLGGEIFGIVGRINNFRIDRYDFDDVVVFYPDEQHYGYGLRSGDRNGTIGGELLSHFNYVIDYTEGWLYLKKSEDYDKTFEFDLSGLEITSFGNQYEIIIVKDVRVDSPAWNAGVRKGDIIESINGKDAQRTSLNFINALIRSKAGKRIFMRIKRGEEELKVRFDLERLI